ncbi:MAG: DUF4330 domain-containing protein [Tissierellales bacterium]
MAIINKKGKILGLINIVDLFIVVAIIVIIVGGILKFGKLGKISEEGTQEIKLSILVEGVSEGLANAIGNDDLLRDSVRGTDFGRVQGKAITPHKEIVIGKDGKVEFLEIPDSYDLVIDIIARGAFTDNGVLLSNYSVFIGSEIRLKSSLYVFNSEIINIME